MHNNEIEIIVKGSAASGKTTVIELIERALFQNEFYDVATISAEHFPVMTTHFQERLRTLKDRNTKFTVVEQQAPRNWSGPKRV